MKVIRFNRILQSLQQSSPIFYTTSTKPKLSITPKYPTSVFNNQPRYRFSEEPKKPKYESKQKAFELKTEEMMNKPPEEQEVYYTKSENKVTKVLAALSLLGLLVLYNIYKNKEDDALNKLDNSISGIVNLSPEKKIKIGGQWELFNTSGERFGSQDLEGTYYLIYFGFTNCPDVCPSVLIRLSRALKKIRSIPEKQYLNLKIVFVSVDPQRDTPEKINKFLSFFDKNIIGVTSKTYDDPQLQQCMKNFKIYANKVQFENENTVIKGRKAYTIDHTVLAYLMSDSNQYLMHLGPNLSQMEIYKSVVDKILENQHDKIKIVKKTNQL